MRSTKVPFGSRFKGKKIAVVGDVVADQFLSGTISRVSREAPVFILKHSDTETRPGAAANAAANVAALGGIPLLVGTIGEDKAGEELRISLKTHGVSVDTVVTDPARQTTVKLRVLAGQTYASRQQVIRIDYENESQISDEAQLRLSELAKQAVSEADAVVFSDYSYGTASPDLIAEVHAIAKERERPAIADSRYGLANFSGFTSATPNQEEAEAILTGVFEVDDAEKLRTTLGLDSLVVTLGGRGMAIAEKGRHVAALPAIGSAQPVDVTGAGDTVIAAYALGLAAGLSPFEAASNANHAGGIVVMKRGTAVATIDELEHSLTAYSHSDANVAANEF